MDIIYIFRHSTQHDIEIRYSLRGLARYAPWAGKVWVFGDRPEFLSADRARIEHVPHEYTARVGGFRTPVTKGFLLLFLASLIPELSFEFVWFCDDYILLDEVPQALIRRDRYLEDLSQVKQRGQGVWKGMLWQTYDTLRRLGYPGLNFESHTPRYLTKKRVFDAYCDLKDYVSQDRWYGMLGATAIMNHALKAEQTSAHASLGSNDKMQLTLVRQENLVAGFYDKPAVYEEIVQRCAGKKFLNFDDVAFSPDMQRFLAERFPSPSIYEKQDFGEVSERTADSYSNSSS
jgi:hypothetical protein